MSIPGLSRSRRPVLSRGRDDVASGLAPADIISGKPDPPTRWQGSRGDWLCSWALKRLGLQDGQDFAHPTTANGARLDFEIRNPPATGNLLPDPAQMPTSIRRPMVESAGIRAVVIGKAELERDPLFYVSEALRGVEHGNSEEG